MFETNLQQLCYIGSRYINVTEQCLKPTYNPFGRLPEPRTNVTEQCLKPTYNETAGNVFDALNVTEQCLKPTYNILTIYLLFT